MILWKLLLTLILLSIQVLAIVAVRRAPADLLVRLGFWQYRGDDLIPELKRQGEDLRRNPDALRGTATLSTICYTLVLDVLLAQIWLG